MKLTKKELVYLSDIYPEASSISLLSTVNAEKDGKEEDSLKEKGVLADGGLTKEAKEILDIVAGANHASRLVVRDGLTYLEKYTYRVGENIVVVENEGSEMDVTILKDFSSIGFDVSQYVGLSSRKTTGVEIVFSVEETMAFFALVDLYREYSLKSYFGEEVPDAVSLKAMKEHMGKTGDSSLVDLFRVNFGYQPPNSLEKTLESLIKKECISKDKDYRLAGEYALFAKNFLVPSSMILVESFSIGSDQVLLVGGGLGLVAGVCDQCFIFADLEEVEVKAVAGLEMVQTLEGFLICPEL
ncbi:MAG: hypothetical protein RBS51_04940 [Anaerovoracaceae bacterium]|jgi:hypothetical protein|nr:hypothetical protein [Anaerovoracaceae bacterium]